jgi:hypothetical protein
VLSRLDGSVRTLFVIAALWVAVSNEVRAAQPAAGAPAGVPDKAEIARAIETVKADPNLATERTIKTLRWKQSTTSTRRTPAWLRWLAGLFGWIGESTRVLIWVGALALAGLLAVYLTRILSARLASTGPEPFIVPTHVRDLDIRPESLPADIGAAARHLWERGEQRAALALLYRGMLSRLAHVHGVPILDSSTEGDCLALATTRLPDRSDYIDRLVRVWQRFGYGRQSVDTTAVYSLCNEFATAMRARES